MMADDVIKLWLTQQLNMGHDALIHLGFVSIYICVYV